MKLKMKSLFIIGFVILNQLAFSQGTISGTIIDETSGEALPGVNITNTEKFIGTSSGADGSFQLSLSVGMHQINISMIGYADLLFDVKIENGEKTNLGRIILTPEVIGLGEITVISSVAVDRQSPLTVSNISSQMIETRQGDEPLPMVMKQVPGVYATRTGGGSGDAAINIRGFKQENTTLLLNGIPISSVENGLVYWNNWLGLSDATARIQVQRGLGASPAAMNSVGGTINIITKTTEAVEGGSIGLSVTDYGNLKTNFSYSTGKLDNGMSVTLMGSYFRGAGYVDATYVRGWGYFLSISKEFNQKH
jgi:iron complex outermembrane receptor protein